MKASLTLVLIALNLSLYSVSSLAGSGLSPPLFIIEQDQLLKRLDSTDIIVLLDVRETEKYQAGHIPGASNLPLWKTFNQNNKNYKLAPIGTIQRLLGNAGIDRETEVVLYDDGQLIDAGRMFWILEVLGHTKARVLNGGFEHWQKHSLMQTVKPSKVKPKHFQAAIKADKLATKFSTRLATGNSNITIIDSRSKNEYLGYETETRRKGHIPGAISIPWNANLQPNNTTLTKSVAELKSIYSKLDISKPIITYCNRGKHSSFSYLILRELGYKVSHYDGSWLEWSEDQNLPVVSPLDHQKL